MIDRLRSQNRLRMVIEEKIKITNDVKFNYIERK